MKNKQIVAFIVAAAVFVVTGVSSVAINTWAKKTTASYMSVYDKMLATGETETPAEDYVAVVEVEGTIYSEPTTSAWGSTEGYDHPSTMKYIDQLMEDKYNKAIMLYMNTPGGEVTASDDLYLKLMEYKEKTGRKIYCYYADQSCSGGYYISMAADEIYANRNCWTGSIGVIVQLTNMQGLYEKLGIQEINITSGANKAMGSAGEELTAEQRAILQSLVDEAYEQFVSIIAESREMDINSVKKLADGRIYTAKQALSLDLIDGICTHDEYLDKIREELGSDITIYERENDDSFGLANLFASLQNLKSRSDAEVVEDMLKNDSMGGVMYYADGLQ